MSIAKQKTAAQPRSVQDLRWRAGFAALGPYFGSAQVPTPIESPYLIAFNRDAAGLLDLDPQAGKNSEFVEIFSGNSVPAGAAPFSQLYAGHQFGSWAGQLGDGRAISLGEVGNSRGEAWDVQLKGAGKTPYSRFADGRAVLRSTIREYLASAAMAGLGIATTRALCITGSQAPVYRETVETSAILTRLAPSYVRFGSFEIFFYREQFELLETLATHVINAHFPELAHVESGPKRFRAWAAEVITRTAELIADWQAVGFCHGVMNTDNMSILGLTLDYGPYGFLDHFDPGWICNHSDTGGRYAYDQQPSVALWNLGRFVQAILPLLSDEPDTAVAIGQDLLQAYRGQFDAAYMRRMRAKLGLQQAEPDDADLLDSLLKLMARDSADFSRSFRALGRACAGEDSVFLDEFKDREAVAAWLAEWRARLASEDPGDEQSRRAGMDAANPKYVLRNYLAQAAIEQAQAGNYAEIQRLHKLLSRPFDEQPENADYARLPPDWAQHISVSCSS